MPAGAVCPELHGEIALLCHTHHGNGALDAGHRARDDHAALVIDELQPHAALREQGRDARIALPTGFLVVAEGEHHGALGPESGADQRLCRFELPDDAGLGIDGAAPPDIAICDVSRKRRVRPVGFTAGGDGHDVHMRHQQVRRQYGIAALPREEQAVVIHDLARGLRAEGGIGRGDPVAEGHQCLQRCVHISRRCALLPGDRSEAQGFSQTARDHLAIEGIGLGCSGGRCGRRWRHEQRAAQQHGEERE